MEETNVQSNNEKAEEPRPEIPMPVPDSYPPQLPPQLPPQPPPQPSEAEVLPEPAPMVDSTLQNNQVQYSAPNYMTYPPHMADPSIMSHNYPYMTAPSGYSDYLSMYHAAGRIPARPYPNAYASYQGYNYAYSMQQMYDGRSMAAYPPGNYPAAQMLPPTPPLPAGQPVSHQLNNFNPPLPTDYSASFPPTESAPHVIRSADSQPLPVESKEIKANVLSEKDLPPLPENSMSEERPTENTFDDQNAKQSDTASAPPGELEKEVGKLSADEQSSTAFENHVLSEDVNR